MNSGYLVLQEM